jgi:hypothetical protein
MKSILHGGTGAPSRSWALWNPDHLERSKGLTFLEEAGLRTHKAYPELSGSTRSLGTLRAGGILALA